MSMRVSWPDNELVVIKEARSVGREKRRRAMAPESFVIPESFLQSPNVSIEKTLEISFPESQLRRSDVLPVIALDVEASSSEAALLILRHPSGALTFHSATASGGQRRGSVGSPIYQFRVPVRETNAFGSRRGVVTQIINAVIIKATRPALDLC